MCGLVGIYRPGDPGIEEASVERMLESIRHRGPDGSGTFFAPHIGLGHVRLAILDLSDLAAQPMVSRCQRYVIVFNGEIFNFGCLRSDLEKIGVRVRSTGDTEVLLEHLVAFGVEKTLPKLEGQCALALWDREEEVLVLARDRHGIKPLYYTIAHAGEIRFASEIKVLASESAEPDPASVCASLLGLSVTWGEHTMLRDVRSVRPGEWLAFRGSVTPRRSRFFRLTEFVDPELHEELNRSPQEATLGRLDTALQKSIDYQLISDAPLACLVSGGVDSSLIAALATERQSGIRLYHADVESDSERPAAQALAEHLGLELRCSPVSNRAILEEIAAVTYFNDLPLIYHQNSVPFFLVCRFASREGIKVLLTGEGSDEYFLGYPHYALAPILDRWRAVRGALQRGFHRGMPKLAALLWPRNTDRFPDLLGQFLFRFEEELVQRESEEAVAFIDPRRRRTHVMTLTLIQEHLVSLLHRNDRLGMASGLESRFPFLGHDLARLAANLPARFKLRFSARMHDRRHPFIVDKWAVRELARRRLPRGLADRRKLGFPVSLHQRLSFPATFFRGGFIEAWFALGGAAFEELERTAPKQWWNRLMLLDVWGRLFVLGASVDQVQAHIRERLSR